MKIALVRPPFYSLLNAAEYKLNTYPLNLSYLSAALKTAGHDTVLVDGEVLDMGGLTNRDGRRRGPSPYVEMVIHESVRNIDEVMLNPDHPAWKRLADEIFARGPDAVAITCYSVSMNSVRNICGNIRKRSNVKIILGGIHPTSLPIHSLEYTGADVAVIGEGERVLPEVVRAIESGEPNRLEKIGGVAYRAQDGGIRLNDNRHFIEPLDSLAFPDRDFFDKGLYYGDVISTSRGCPFECNYCASKVMWQRAVRFRSVESVISEISLLKHKYNAEFVRIVDDTFTLDRGRTLEICRRLREGGLNTMRLSVGSRADRLDGEIIAELKKSGVETVTLGIESASPKILKFIRKRETVEDMARALELLRENDIQSHAFFMVGFPGETRDDIDMSKEFIARYKPDYAEVNMVTPYPGTELWDLTMKGKEGAIHNWYQRFHQGLAGGLTEDYDLNEEYASFVNFTKEANVRGMATTIKRRSDD